MKKKTTTFIGMDFFRILNYDLKQIYHHEIRDKKIRFNTGDFFDSLDSHSKVIPNEKKRETLRSIVEQGISPLELLYFHVLEYSEMQNYSHVLMEAPNSAFALCWEKGRMV